MENNKDTKNSMLTHPVINVLPDKILDILYFITLSADRVFKTLDLKNLPEDIHPMQRKAIDTFYSNLVRDGFKKLENIEGSSKELENVRASYLGLVSGRVESYVLFAYLTLSEYNSEIEYIVDSNQILSKRLRILPHNTAVLNIILEPTIENPYIVGSSPVLGNWNPENALPLTFIPSKVAAYHIDVPVALGKELQYKFITKRGWDNGVVEWETPAGENRIVTADHPDLSPGRAIYGNL